MLEHLQQYVIQCHLRKEVGEKIDAFCWGVIVAGMGIGLFVALPGFIILCALKHLGLIGG